MSMLSKLSQLFKLKKDAPEQLFLQQHQIEYDDEKGFIIEGIVLNAIHAERLVYFSNRRISQFDDLSALFYSAMLINEKIDLEIANERFVVRLGNNLENLTELKRMIKLLNDYYYQFIRDKK
ncbi:hypothetical protein [Acinetobacter johnsonii]|uniref:hypothetical protein n=1 Tax=Acinetobacter johnsonii TaxID=40214 RepID=UPI00191B6766|nr:hypothetical protein [Acinetobacter johnsonii]QQT93858.1 hypothetical protein I6I51_03680 [Acinetobacter johnsonii]